MKKYKHSPVQYWVSEGLAVLSKNFYNTKPKDNLGLFKAIKSKNVLAVIFLSYFYSHTCQISRCFVEPFLSNRSWLLCQS